MYASDFTEWSAARMGPKRDVVGELAKAVRAEGLIFGVSSHRVEHWWFFDQGKTFDSDVRDPKLNIGPRPDGTIPEVEQQMLREIGQWLGSNGEAIYGTRPWTIFGEGPTAVVEGPFTDTKRKAFTAQDIRFTRKDTTLYAIALAWPDSGVLTIASLAQGSQLLPAEIASVELLGASAPVSTARDARGLHVTLPPAPPVRPHALALRIQTRR